jgi:hypothetical protein
VLLRTRCLASFLCILGLLCQAFAVHNPNDAKQQDQALKLKADLVEIRAAVTDRAKKAFNSAP